MLNIDKTYVGKIIQQKRKDSVLQHQIYHLFSITTAQQARVSNQKFTKEIKNIFTKNILWANGSGSTNALISSEILKIILRKVWNSEIFK